MKTLTCSAPDCGKPFKSIMPHAKYCSDKCRWRDKKREQVADRKERGLCQQCGGEMSPDENAPSYCKRCQRRFRNIYFKKKFAERD